MRTALYYPHTEIQKESLLRTALLLWDRIEVIVPWPAFRPHYQDRSMAEAFELIGHAHFPSERAKAEAHRKVLEFIDAEIPSPFLYEGGAPGYPVYSGKLLPETWHELRRARLANHGSFEEEEMTRPMGLALMNILADCCAGKTRARITDEQDAYRNVMTILSADKRRVEGDNQNREFLVPRLVKVLDTDRIPIRDLIAFRRREETESKGAELRALRHRYREHVEKFVKEMNQLEDPSWPAR